MKLILNKEKFEKHLVNINKAIDANPYLVILKGIIIEATPTIINLIASNGMLSVKETIVVNKDFIVETTGKVLIPGRLFVQIIKKIDQEIILETNNKALNIKTEGFETSINLLNIEEYPTINFQGIDEEIEINKKIEIDVEKIKDIIKNVAFAADERSDTIYLNGVHFKTKDQKIYVTASNRYRLAQEIIPINENYNFDFIVMAKNLKDLLTQNAKGKITWNLSEAKILTSYQNSKILLKLIDAIYPNVEKNIPHEFTHSLSIDVNHLLTLIDKASLLNSESNNTLTFKITPKTLIIESVRSEVGNIRVETKQIEWTGQDMKLTFNGNFLREAITKFNDKITINFSKTHKGIVIKGQSNPHLTQIVLPHRSSE